MKHVLVLVLVAFAACGDSNPAIAPDAPPIVEDAPPLPPDMEQPGGAKLTIANANITFDPTLVGATDTTTVKVTNEGQDPTGPLEITVTGDASFQASAPACPPGLIPNASCMIALVFTPQSAGILAATLSVSASPGGTVEASLSAVGVAPAALTITSDVEDVGDALVGSFGSTVATLVVTNVGEVPTGDLRVQPTGADPGEFGVVEQCSGHNLDPGATCTIEVRLEPTERGGKSASIAVLSAPGGFVSANVRGRAISRARIATPFIHKTFGSVATDASATTSIVVENTGDVASGPVTLTSVGGTGFTVVGGTCANLPLAAGATCTVDVKLASAVAGAKTGKLTIAATPGGTQVVTFDGVVTATSQLAISPAVFAYPAVAAAAAGTTQTFTITNRSTGSSGTLVTQSNSSRFQITSDGCNGLSLAPTVTCDVTVRFLPDVAAPHVGRLDVSSASAGAVTAAVRGVALAPASLVTSRTSQRFGSVALGATVDANIELRNVGDAVADVPALSVTGADAGEFSATQTCTAQLAPREACTITVRFAPASAGPKTAAVAGLPLTATGVAAGGIEVLPSRFAFTPRVLETGPTLVQAFTVRNTTSAPISNLAITGTPGFEVIPVGLGCSATVAPGASCTVNVRFLPTAATVVAGSLAVTSTAGNLEVALDARGTPRVEVVAVNFATSSASAFDLGSQVVGGAIPNDVFVTVRNNVEASNFISVIEAFGAPPQFAGAGSNCTGVVSVAGQACTFRFRFAPTTPGSKAGTATILLGQTVNANNTVPFALSGQGL